MSTEATNRIAKNALALYFRMLVVLGTSLYTTRIVLNALGATDYGLYSVAGAIVSLFAFLNNAMSMAAQRFMGADIGRKDATALGRTFNAVLALHIVIALVIVVVSESLGMWLLMRKLEIPHDRISAAITVFHFSVAATVAMILKSPFNALILARERMPFFSLTSIVEAAFKLAVAFAIVRVTFDKLEFYAALTCLLSWLMLLWYLLFCRFKFPESRLALHRNGGVYRNIVGLISWGFIGNLSSALRDQGTNILLNVFFGPLLNAAYGVMGQAKAAATQFSGSFSLALNPQIYQSHAQGNFPRLHALVFTGAKLNFILLSVLVIPALYGMEYVLKLWLWNPPEHSSTFVKWMLVNLLLETISQPMMTAAFSTGKIRNYQLVVGGTILLSLPLTYLAFRFTGSPVTFLYLATSIQLITFGLRVWFLRYMINLQVEKFLKLVALPLLALGCIGGMLIYLAKTTIGAPYDFIGLVLGCFSILLPWVMACYFIGLNRRERKLLLEQLTKKVQNDTKQKSPT